MLTPSLKNIYPFNFIYNLLGSENYDVLVQPVYEFITSRPQDQQDYIRVRFQEHNTIAKTTKTLKLTNNQMVNIQNRIDKSFRREVRHTKIIAVSRHELANLQITHTAQEQTIIELKRLLDEALHGKFPDKVISLKPDMAKITQLEGQDFVYIVTPIFDVAMSTRLLMVLLTNGFDTLESVIEQPESEIKKLRNLGQVSFDELETILTAHNLHFTTFS